MQKLSVVIITFNEERNIERCLQSVQEIADEIVVLDSFSTDKTEEICKKYKVDFQQHTFDGHIQQKNRALQLAQNKWVLSLDADEVPNSILLDEIKKLKELNFPQDAYSFNRLNNYLGKWIKHSSWYPDKKLRLWNTTKGKWGGENPHDKVIMFPNSKIIYIKGDLLHYSYYTIEEHITQANKFSSIAAQNKYDKGKKVTIFKILFAPFFKFIKEYFIKLGFLDGLYGFTISSISAHETFLKYIKLYQKNHKINT